jgi:hypothetical protein
VGEKEQGKFAEIEELLGAPVLKGVVPEMFGPTPLYAPKQQRGNKFIRKR